MPTPAYLTLKGKTQGFISQDALTAKSIGGKAQVNHKDEILVQAFKHISKKPVDPQNGQPTGPRVYEPLIITKEFDRTSPMLYNAMAAGEKMEAFELKWYRTVENKLEHYFTITLTDAIITGVKTYMPNCLDVQNKSFTHLEDVSFSFKAIEWQHVKSSTSGSDDWTTPVEE